MSSKPPKYIKYDHDGKPYYKSPEGDIYYIKLPKQEFGSRKRRSAPRRTKRRTTKRKSTKKSKASILKASKRRSVLKARKTRCSNLLKKKISINMKELKKGTFKNRAQALAVSYSQVSKRYPSCAKMYKR